MSLLRKRKKGAAEVPERKNEKKKRKRQKKIKRGIYGERFSEIGSCKGA